jgi:hypothetical protein
MGGGQKARRLPPGCLKSGILGPIYLLKSLEKSRKGIEKSVYKGREERWLEGEESVAIGKCNGKRIGRLSDKSPSILYWGNLLGRLDDCPYQQN